MMLFRRYNNGKDIMLVTRYGDSPHHYPRHSLNYCEDDDGSIHVVVRSKNINEALTEARIKLKILLAHVEATIIEEEANK